MKIKRKNLLKHLFIFLAVICFISVIIHQGNVKGSPSETPEIQAKAIIDRADLKGGLIVHLNCGEGKLTEALRLNDRYQVQGLDSKMGDVRKARDYILSKGNYGPVSIDLLTGNELPYNDNFVNMIVADGLGKISKNEAMRALAPNGVLLIKKGSNWNIEVKPVPDKMDEWNQYLYNSEGNMVSKDEIIGPIKHYQWIGYPRWSRHHDTKASLSAMVSANGRIFYIMDEGPENSVILPAENYITARDAYNGTILWKKPVPEGTVGHLFPLKSGPAYLPRRLIATGDRVYATLGNYAALSELDAATGEVLRTFPNTEDTSEIVLSGDTLFLLIGRPEKKEELFSAKKTSVWANMDIGRFEWGWNGEPAKIVSVNIPDGKVNWTKKYPVAPLSLTADSKSVYFHDGKNLVSLERKNGTEKWKTEAERKITGAAVVKGSTDANSYETGYASRLVVQDGVLLFSNGLRQLIALSANDGKLLWSQKQPASGHYTPEDIFVIDGLVWTGAIAMPNDPGNYIAWDLHTGELKKDLPNDTDIYWFHQRCYPSRATEKYFLPSRTGLEFVDEENGHWEINHYARGGCSYGIMPSNGLVYLPPNACACYMEAKLSGISALGGDIQSDFNLEEAAKENRLEKGPAYSAKIKDDSDQNDWSTYRHDSGRTGSTPDEVSADASTKWRLNLGGRLSSPVSAGGKVYVAQIDAHTVHAIDSGSGKILWSYTASGRVDSPPTIYKGRVLFGSADGYVYSLNSADGSLIWRFRAAPKDRRMMAFEQIESIWPVNGSVLIQDDKLYCVAGRSMFLDGGIRFLILDPVTGKKIDEKVMDENDPYTGENMHKYVKDLNMAVGLADILSSDGKSIYMRSQQFDLKGNRKNIEVRNYDDQFGEGAHVFSPIGFLDDSLFYRTTMLYGKTIKGGWGGFGMAGRVTPSGKILVVDNDTVYGYGQKPEFLTESLITEYSLYAADKNTNSDAVKQYMEESKKTMFYPGAGDWKEGQKAPKTQMSAVQYKWQVDKPDIFARAMVLADKTLFVAGPPDILDEEDIYFFLNDDEVKEQLARQSDLHKGKEGGKMWAVSAKTGEKLKEFKLDSLPVWDGMAASKGQLYVSTMDGELLCYK